MITTEWCPYCGLEKEYKITEDKIVQCDCGKFIVLCSVCNEYNKCNTCKYDLICKEKNNEKEQKDE